MSWILICSQLIKVSSRWSIENIKLLNQSKCYYQLLTAAKSILLRIFYKSNYFQYFSLYNFINNSLIYKYYNVNIISGYLILHKYLDLHRTMLVTISTWFCQQLADQQERYQYADTLYNINESKFSHNICFSIENLTSKPISSECPKRS